MFSWTKSQKKVRAYMNNNNNKRKGNETVANFQFTFDGGCQIVALKEAVRSICIREDAWVVEGQIRLSMVSVRKVLSLYISQKRKIKEKFDPLFKQSEISTGDRKVTKTFYVSLAFTKKVKCSQREVTIKNSVKWKVFCLK